MRPDNLNEKPDRLGWLDALSRLRRRLHSPDGSSPPCRDGEADPDDPLHQRLDLLALKLDHLNGLITEATPTESQSILIDEEMDEG